MQEQLVVVGKRERKLIKACVVVVVKGTSVIRF